MTVHIVKLCVGIDSIEHLTRFQEGRRAQFEATGDLLGGWIFLPVFRHRFKAEKA